MEQTSLLEPMDVENKSVEPPIEQPSMEPTSAEQTSVEHTSVEPTSAEPPSLQTTTLDTTQTPLTTSSLTSKPVSDPIDEILKELDEADNNAQAEAEAQLALETQTQNDTTSPTKPETELTAHTSVQHTSAQHTNVQQTSPKSTTREPVRKKPIEPMVGARAAMERRSQQEQKRGRGMMFVVAIMAIVAGAIVAWVNLSPSFLPTVQSPFSTITKGTSAADSVADSVGDTSTEDSVGDTGVAETNATGTDTQDNAQDTTATDSVGDTSAEDSVGDTNTEDSVGDTSVGDSVADTSTEDSAADSVGDTSADDGNNLSQPKTVNTVTITPDVESVADPVEETETQNGENTPIIKQENRLTQDEGENQQDSNATQEQINNQPTQPITTSAILYESGNAGQIDQALSGFTEWKAIPQPLETGGPSRKKVIHARVEFPQRNMILFMNITNHDFQQLPASHLIDLTFVVPKETGSLAVENVNQIILKETQQDVGKVLNATPTKIDDGIFLLALNNLEQIRQNNETLLLQRNWIDIPIQFSNGAKALITLEKGGAGDKVFNEVFASWDGGGG